MAEIATGKVVESAEDLDKATLVPVEAYLSPEYALAEQNLLWRKVWQQACRVEELPEIGSYLTYDILSDSLLIVRTASDRIDAYHNVCSHRGRRLVDVPLGAHNASGKKLTFVCGFHGWAYDAHGRCTHVPAEDNWGGALNDERTRLGQVNVDTWGGWVWINLDPECEPLRDYLNPAADMLDPFELQNQRCRWRKWIVLECNWKVALEAFNETYHVATTHPEFMEFGDFTGWGKAQGRHSHIGYDAPKGLEENKGKLRLGAGSDPRVSTAELQTYTWREVNTNTTKTMVDAALRLEDELPEGTPANKVLRHWLEAARADDEKRGVFWPKVDPEHVGRSGTNWQIFPNFLIGHAVNNMLCYRARPYELGNPGKCIFEAAVYELYPPGDEPAAEWEYVPLGDPRWGSVLPQDFANMTAVQQGMRNGGFRGTMPNPKAEQAVTSLHRNLARYMGAGHQRQLD
jgi:phenylpropionate dioxygenase-like ring-hydroxylating dioxygenase large terminal subunit